MEPEPSPAEKLLVRVFIGLFGRPLYRGFVDSLGLQGNEVVLDFGSGWGMNSRMIAEALSKGGKIVCLDISRGWLEVAKRRLRGTENAEFILGDISQAKIPDKTFDVIVVHFVLHDIDRSVRGRTVAELARVLKDEGRLVIRDPLSMGHGITVEELRSLMTGVGLRESKWSTDRWPMFREAYHGTWVKPTCTPNECKVA